MFNRDDIVLMEDDCAPDAYEEFAESFEKKLGMTVEDFKAKAFRVPLKMGQVYSHKGYRLCWFCDDPFYTLYKH